MKIEQLPYQPETINDLKAAEKRMLEILDNNDYSYPLSEFQEIIKNFPELKNSLELQEAAKLKIVENFNQYQEDLGFALNISLFFFPKGLPDDLPEEVKQRLEKSFSKIKNTG